jgi:hypothetical protein
LVSPPFAALLFATLLGVLPMAAAPAEPTAPVQAPPAPEPATGIARWFDPDSAPFIPVPEIETSPQSGVTVGVIPVFLSTNRKGEIDQILAPDIIHSSYFGWGARWRTFRNPSEDERWSVVGGGKEHAEREFDAEYDLGLLRERDWSWVLHAMYDRSATGRFYGVGNDSPKSGETTFVNNQGRVEVTAGRNFSRSVQLAYMARLNTVEIEQGVLAGVPSIETRYPLLPGVGDEHELHQRLILSYDTRDATEIPRHGERVAAFAGLTQRGLVSSVSYSFVGADVSAYRPLRNDTTLAMHAALRYMPRYADAPFWALSAVGGDTDVLGEAQPLRAFGDNRYLDRNSFAGSVELRMRVVTVHAFATEVSLEPAPFVDFGKVFARMSENPLSRLHPAAGLGIRMLAVPFIVGYVDIGYGKDGVTVFTGIDYPF